MWSMTQASLAVRCVISWPQGGGGGGGVSHVPRGGEFICPMGVSTCPGGGATCPVGGFHMLRGLGGGFACPEGGGADHMIYNLQHCIKAPTTAIGPSPLLATAVNHQQILGIWNTDSVFVCVTLEMILWAQSEQIIWAVYTCFDHPFSCALVCPFVLIQSCIHFFGDLSIPPSIHLPSIHSLYHSSLHPFFGSFIHSFVQL